MWHKLVIQHRKSLANPIGKFLNIQSRKLSTRLSLSMNYWVKNLCWWKMAEIKYKNDFGLKTLHSMEMLLVKV